VLISVDFAHCTDADALRAAVITAVPDWPAECGRQTWPGFCDGLTDHLLHPGREQVALMITNIDPALATLPDETAVLLDLVEPHLCRSGACGHRCRRC